MRVIPAVVEHLLRSLAELVRLKEPSTSMGPDPALNYVRHAVWGMPYVDDACIVS